MSKRNILLKVIFCVLAVGGWLEARLSAAATSSAEMYVCVEVKERLVLRVQTGGRSYEAAGDRRADVIAPFRLGDETVAVEVWARVPRNHGVQLLARQLAYEAENESAAENPFEWEASGPGFRDGTLSPGASSLMGSWSGPGQFSGSIQYRPRYPEKGVNPDQVVTIHYSLIAL